MSKVLVGLSGGVDSAVAALLLKDQGYDVVGVTLRTWESDSGEESRCCEIEDASDIAGILGIPFYAFNCTFDFKEKGCNGGIHPAGKAYKYFFHKVILPQAGPSLGPATTMFVLLT